MANRSRASRTRGPDVDNPVNRADIETPGFATPKIRRNLNSAEPEHRALILQDAYRLAKAGLTEFEIAEFFGITRVTLWRWKDHDDAFREAMELGAGPANERVEASLYHRATGYTYRSEKVFQYEGQIIRAPILEHVPPDTTAAIFWLKNRDRDKWQDVNKIDMTASITANGDYDPRKLAMAMMVALREGLEAPVKTIEHKEAAE